MHMSSLLRMRWFVKTFLLNSEHIDTIRSVIDIGSYDVNGSYKQYFPASLFDYTGLDMEAGPNVDIVPKNTYSWSEIPDETYDIVISGQVLEHAEFFWITMTEMVRVLKRGGLLCLILPRGHIRHRFPVDCYRFDVDGVVALARYTNLEVLHASCDLAPPGSGNEWYEPNDEDTLLVAKKPDDWKGIINPKKYSFTPYDIDAFATGFLAKDQQAIKNTKKQTGSHIQAVKDMKVSQSGDDTVDLDHKPSKADKKPEKVDYKGYYDACRYDILALITQNETEPISALEIGCSGGGTLLTMKEMWKNASVKGVELVPEIAEIAQGRGLDVICCNIEETELPYEKESFDYIILGDVIEHLREPEEALFDLRSLLKKGGHILCSVPNIMHASIINSLIQGKFEYVDAGIMDRTHLRFFTMHSVKQLFSSINMEIEVLLGITWGEDVQLTDIINEEINSEKLFTFQQLLISAKKV